MQKKHLIIILIPLILGIFSCATKEELIPELTEIAELKKVLTPFERIQDSPTCIIPVRNYVTITTSEQIPGVTGDVDLDMTQFNESFDEAYLSGGDYSGRSRIIISLGRGYVATGIYSTVGSAYLDDQIQIQIASFQPSSPYPRVTVKSGQKVLIQRLSQTSARVKFCDLKLDMTTVGNGTGTGTINGDIYCYIQ